MQSASPAHPLCLFKEGGNLLIEGHLGKDPWHRPADFGPSLLESLDELIRVSGVRRAQDQAFVDANRRRRPALHAIGAVTLLHEGCGAWSQGLSLDFAV